MLFARKLCFCILAAVSAPGQQYTITTAAGAFPLGDRGPATSAFLNNPVAVASDSVGNVYIADTANGRIRKVTPDGTITSVLAGLGTPTGLAVDSADNLFVADSGSSQILRVGSNGGVSIVAGRQPGFGGDGDSAALARLLFPSGLAFDSAGNLYVIDGGNNRIRRIAPDGTISTVAGDGTAGFSGDGGAALSAEFSLSNSYIPSGLAVDGSGNLIVADTGNGRVRIISATDGTVHTVAGGGFPSNDPDQAGPATAAALFYPSGVAVDSTGDIFVSLTNSNRVRKVTPDGTITTFAGTGRDLFAGPWLPEGDGGPATFAQLRFPTGLALDNAGNLLIADGGSDSLRLVATDGTIHTIAGAPFFGGDGGPATAALINHPSGLALGPDGTLYISDWRNSRVRGVGPDGTITTVAGTGDYGFAGDGEPATAAVLSHPGALTMDSLGNLYIIDDPETGLARVRRLGADGTITTVAGGGIDPRDGIQATKAPLYEPQALAIDPNGDLLIAEFGPYPRIRKLSFATGTIATIAGSPPAGYGGDGGPALAAQFSFYSGVGLAVDSSGNIYVADSNNSRIRRIGTDGTVSTVAGTGQCCSGGDGGPALQATLAFPSNVAADPSGNLFIVDRGTGRIRRITADGTISTITGGLRIDCCIYIPGIVPAPDRTIYVSDGGDRRVVRLSPPQ